MSLEHVHDRFAIEQVKIVQAHLKCGYCMPISVASDSAANQVFMSTAFRTTKLSSPSSQVRSYPSENPSFIDASGLSSVFSRNGAMAPVRTALATRPEPWAPRCLVGDDPVAGLEQDALL